MDERQLLEGLIVGDERAARAFVSEYRFVVMGVLRRIRQLTKQDQDDLFNEVFDRVWRDDRLALRKVAGDWRPGSLSRYLRTVALRLAIDCIRARREVPFEGWGDDDDLSDDVAQLLQLRGLGGGGVTPSDPVDPQVLVQIAELRRMFGDAMARLTERCRALISFVHLAENSYEEASAHFNLSRTNLGVSLMRCRQRLADVLLNEYPAVREYLREAL